MDLKCVDRSDSALDFLMHLSSTLSLDYLIERIWEGLGLVKVYTKKRGERPDLSDPVCLRKGATIEVCIIILNFPSTWRNAKFLVFMTFCRMFAWESINPLQQISETDSFGKFVLFHSDTLTSFNKFVIFRV